MSRLFFLAFVLPLFVTLSLKILNVVYFSGGVCRSDVKLNGKVAIVTGANSGIGRETALDFARRGARVYLASRSEERTAPVVEMIRSATGNEDVHFKRLELGSLSSIRHFAEDFLKSEERLDILVNNAAILTPTDQKTEDGFEIHMGVNHLGHFLLTNLLLDVLKRSAPSRVVTVSASAGLELGEIDVVDLLNEKGYDAAWLPGAWQSYWTSFRRSGNSKLANILFSKELARRLKGTGVSTYSLHPGLIKTDMGRNMPSMPTLVLQSRPFSYLIKTAEEGAQTTICCAVDEEMGKETGKYYVDCEVSDETHPHLNDENLAQVFWKKSEKLVGLRT